MRCIFPIVAVLAVVGSAAACFQAQSQTNRKLATSVTPGYSVPKITHSPDGRYGVLVPDREHYDWYAEQNRLINLRSGRSIGVIHAHSGALRANHVEIEKPNWSRDSSQLLWRVSGKWSPTALVFIQLRDGVIARQLNVLDEVQKEILRRTKREDPARYRAAKKENRGSGAAFPDGFTVDVIAKIGPGASLSLPIAFSASLTSNPKRIEDFPKSAEQNSEMQAVLTKQHKLKYSGFRLTSPDRS